MSERITQAMLPMLVEQALEDYREQLPAGFLKRVGGMVSEAKHEVRHPDDAAVYRFAEAMKAKLALARERGLAGWDNPDLTSVEFLAEQLVAHVSKGNAGTFEDVANFAMMLHQRDADPAMLAGVYGCLSEVPRPDADDTLHVWRVTTRHGEQCHFGDHGLACAWAGSAGVVERIELQPVATLTLVSSAQAGVRELEIVCNDELLAAYGNANFGGMDPRTVVRQGVLKCASGYYQGHTSKTICEDLGLIDCDYQLTAKGRLYLWEAFCSEVSI